MAYNTDYLDRCIQTLDESIKRLNRADKNSMDYEIFRNSAVKSFELTLETAGKLVKKSIKPYFATNKAVDKLFFKEVFRYAAKHGLINIDEVERWFEYRDNRNNTAHDYGEQFAKETLRLLPQFVIDAKNLKKNLDESATRSSG